MPEITAGEFQQFVRYQILGTPQEVEKKVNDLEKDNADLRKDKRELTAKLPKDGEVTLPKAKADLLPEYEKLGPPTEVQAKVEKGQKAEMSLAERDRKDAATKFAKAVGLADESVDTMMAVEAIKGATFEVKKGKVKDKAGVEKDGEIGYITLAGENQKALSFAEAVEQIPALKGLKMSTGQTERVGVSYVQQGGGDNAGSQTVFDEIRKEVKAKYTPAAPAEDVKHIPSIHEALGMTR